jgi:hypothetical protein
MLFITSLLLLLLVILVSSVTMFADECHPQENTDLCPWFYLCLGNACKNLPLRYSMLALTLVASLLFGIPSAYLFSVHVQNFSSGKTTNERFTKARAGSITSSTLLSEQLLEETQKRKKRGKCFKCREMCCNVQIISQV